MNNKFLKKANTVIELTSLMDVIFILLAVVVCRQQISMTEKKAEAENVVIEAEAAMKEADEMMDAAEAALSENAIMKEQLELCSDIFSQVTLVTVSLSYDYTHPESRFIRVGVNDQDLTVLSNMVKGNTADGFKKLTEYLDGIMEASNGRPVILSVDRSRILYRDDVELIRIINQYYDKYDNLYSRAD